MIKILVDIDVILDVFLPREEFYQNSFNILNLCHQKIIDGWISADSFSTLHYFLRKKLNEHEAREKIFKYLNFLSVIPVRNTTLVNAKESDLPDFEDNLKMASAEMFHLDFIVTRNVKHYKGSTVPAYIPEELIEKIRSDSLSEKTYNVPFLDLKAQHHDIYNEIDDRFTDIIANTGFILGKYVDEFEQGFAALQGAKYCIGVSSGTDALHVALMALGIAVGDEVVVPVNTFIATSEAVSLIGAVPRFVDCDKFYNIDVKMLREVIQKSEGRIKAIIPVHLYGQPANMKEIMKLADEYGIKVVEDCCQAHLAELEGTKVGNFGDFGAFSFYPGKNLGAYGEGGALITNDQKLFNKAKMIRQHGEIERYHHKCVGHNYRMSALQGAVLGVKLKYIEEWTRRRQQNADKYNALLRDVKGVTIPIEINDVSCVYHLYVIQVDDRDGLQKYLQENGIASGLHYPVPLHLQKAYGELGYKAGDFPIAETAADRILSLPMFPELTEPQITYVCDKIKDFVA